MQMSKKEDQEIETFPAKSLVVSKVYSYLDLYTALSYMLVPTVHTPNAVYYHSAGLFTCTVSG